jgi:hypothetical protein
VVIQPGILGLLLRAPQDILDILASCCARRRTSSISMDLSPRLSVDADPVDSPLPDPGSAWSSANDRSR